MDIVNNKHRLKIKIQLQKSKLDRNIALSVVTSLVLSCLVVLSLMSSPILGLFFLDFIITAALLEIICRLHERNYFLSVIPFLFGNQAILWLTWLYGIFGLLSSYVITVIVCMIWSFITHNTNLVLSSYLHNISVTILVITWIPVFSSFIALLLLSEQGNICVFISITTVVFADTGGYITGMIIGKHLIAPKISPKKSWEGFVGSLIFGTSVSVLLIIFFMEKPVWISLVISFSVVIIAFFGDLFESQIKRSLCIKDIGKSLPGHGGVLDRIDALLYSSVASWFIMSFFL